MQKIERADYIGGSDIAAIVGNSPWKGPYQVWLEKTRQITAPDLTSEAVEMGRVLEPVVADLYVRRMAEAGDVGLGVRTVIGDDGTPGGAVLDPARPWRGGSVDRIVTRNGKDDRILEVKTSRYGDGFGTPGTAEVPDHYVIQQAWYQGLPQYDSLPDPTDLALLKGGQEFSVYVLPRDRELEGILIDAGEKFWKDHVLARVAPPVDGMPFTDEYLRTKFPRVEQPMLMASAVPQANELMECLRFIREERKAKEHEEEVLKQKLMDLIGPAEGIAAAQWLVTWRRTKDSTKVDWQAAAEELLRLNAADESHRKEFMARFTRTVPGTRPLKPQWK